jgi:signal transduction histidine kinase
MEQAGLQVNVSIEDGLAVMAFESSLQRALLNVLTNAEQFSKPGGEVRVVATRADGHAVVDVLDNGPGIPPADRARIFDLFVTTRPEGTGLGLYLAKTAVERCGGTIRAGERPGGGSCFRITVPLAEGK